MSYKWLSSNCAKIVTSLALRKALTGKLSVCSGFLNTGNEFVPNLGRIRSRKSGLLEKWKDGFWLGSGLLFRAPMWLWVLSPHWIIEHRLCMKGDLPLETVATDSSKRTWICQRRNFNLLTSLRPNDPCWNEPFLCESLGWIWEFPFRIDKYHKFLIKFTC